MVGGRLLCVCGGGDGAVGNVTHGCGMGGAYHKAEIDMGARHGSGGQWGSRAASMRGQVGHGLVGTLGVVAVCRHLTVISGGGVAGGGGVGLGVGCLGVARGRP
jgi:hypothetical protein